MGSIEELIAQHNNLVNAYYQATERNNSARANEILRQINQIDQLLKAKGFNPNSGSQGSTITFGSSCADYCMKTGVNSSKGNYTRNGR